MPHDPTVEVQVQLLFHDVVEVGDIPEAHEHINRPGFSQRAAAFEQPPSREVQIVIETHLVIRVAVALAEIVGRIRDDQVHALVLEGGEQVDTSSGLPMILV